LQSTLDQIDSRRNSSIFKVSLQTLLNYRAPGEIASGIIAGTALWVLSKE
jgi:hypothetical protein